ncbi:MAG: rRNA small subunit methyltransferase 1, partial [Bacteroidetes bacterium]
MKLGVLYVVATPIGNLEDISLRAINILGSVDIILCEDTRHTGLLLSKYNLKQARLISYQDFNELQRIPEVIGLLMEGKKIALVSDAGTPLISDPGYKLINECIKRDIKVIPIPGASALTAALSVSGLPTNNFL